MIARQAALEEKARIQAEKALAREARKQLLQQRQAERLTIRSPQKARVARPSTTIAPIDENIGIVGSIVVGVPRRTNRGRQVILPIRFAH